MRAEKKDRTRERHARLLGDKADCLQRMTDEARQIFEQEVAPALRNSGNSVVLSDAWGVDYESRPVSIIDFIYNPFFLGESLRDNIYPAIVNDLVELFEGNYAEVCLGGSVGWGKSREVEIGILYETYLLSCMGDPAAAFGLIPGSTLAFLNVPVDKMQARRVLFGGLYGLLQRSPYFRHVFPYDHKLHTEIRFRNKHITCYPVAATEQSILGEGVFSAAIDEM